MTPPPSLPPTGEGLPEEIVKAIEELRDAEHRHGAAYFSDGGSQVRLERLADRVADRLDATILHHLTEKQERSRLEAEGWGQASVVSCYWIQSKPDHELVPVVNLDLRKLYEATHELTHETALSAARARAERAESDAARFQALMRCGRIKMQGSAGVSALTGQRTYPDNPGMVHFGAEFWVEPEAELSPFTAWGRHCLRALADDILAFEAAGRAALSQGDETE